MKRGFMCLVLIISMLVIPLSAQASATPRVLVDGQELYFDVQPIIVDDFILVPFEEVFQALGFDCYRPNDNTVCCGGCGEKFWMEIGSYVAWAGQKEIDLDVPAQIIDGKVLVPLKAVAQACMCKIEVDKRANIVYITKGEHQTRGISLSEYYNPSMNEFFGYSDNYKFAVQSDEIAAAAYFSGYISEGVEFEWLHFYDDKNYEVVMAETVNTYSSYSDCMARSILPKNQFRIGKWGVQTKVNDTVAQIRYFSIVNDSSLYGSVPWKNGTYTGYISNGVPSGFGRLALNDGTSIEGDFNATWLSHTNLVDKYMGSRVRNMNGVDDYIITCRIRGQWKYPNGAEFTGSVTPWMVSKSEADFKLNKYIIVCEVGGKLYNEGLSRDVSGYYNGFDPSYKFNNFTFQSGPAGSVDNLISVARFDKLASNSNQASIEIGNGWTYTGEVYNTMANGKGSAINVNGEKYSGAFVDNTFEGPGTYTWPDGQKYVGEFKSSAVSGQGTMYYPDGSKKTGTWSSALNDDHTKWVYSLSS